MKHILLFILISNPVSLHFNSYTECAFARDNILPKEARRAACYPSAGGAATGFTDMTIEELEKKREYYKDKYASHPKWMQKEWVGIFDNLINLKKER